MANSERNKLIGRNISAQDAIRHYADSDIVKPPLTESEYALGVTFYLELVQCPEGYKILQYDSLDTIHKLEIYFSPEKYFIDLHLKHLLLELITSDLFEIIPSTPTLTKFRSSKKLFVDIKQVIGY